MVEEKGEKEGRWTKKRMRIRRQMKRGQEGGWNREEGLRKELRMENKRDRVRTGRKKEREECHAGR